MRALGDQFNAERAAERHVAVPLAIGIAGGMLTVGHAGTERRAARVCVGAAARRAGTIAALADPGETLLDGATQSALDGAVATEPRRTGASTARADIGRVHALRAAAAATARPRRG